MRNILTAALAAAFVAACGPAAEEPVVIDEPAAPEMTEAEIAATRNACEDIASLAAAMAESPPFASLRTGKVKLGDTELDDSFTSNVAPGGAPCGLGMMEGFGDDAGMIFVANCPVFSSGPFDREENAEKAKAAFDAVRDNLQACLPKDWASRDGSQPDADSTEMMIFESAEDAKRSMDASFYAYPVQLKKEWGNNGARGQASGWNVTLNFQKQGAKPATEQE